MRTTNILVSSFAVFSLVASLVSGCGPSLTMDGARVKVAPDAAAIAQCQPISGVEAVGSSEEEAQILLRNKAGGMAGNTVYVEDKTENDGKYLLTGKAYNCKEGGA